ncbi:TonB-dependent receptor [Sphingobacterium sp. C459-1T]|uniref:TonB-dependent receptor n=2 Tax=Sphingobacterium faecale TaxID=2803775 RepID=A0ABS1R8I6_9SPHI|nr:TonB-dependent receptor [Sphingobacterium faecale]
MYPVFVRFKQLIIMKLIILLTLTLSLHASAYVNGQKITLHVKNAELSKVLNSIQRQTGYDIFLNKSFVRNIRLDVNMQNKPLPDALEEILSAQALDFNILDKTIIIKPRAKPLVPKEVAKEQQEQITSGIVRDTLGNPLIGVSIMIKGQSAKGTTTDINGRYSLAYKTGDVVVIAMMGYKSQEIRPASTTNFEIMLLPDNSELSEVVVTAFGTSVKRQDMVGSVTSINPSELKVPSSNLTSALAGRLAGMIAYQDSGEPGADNANFFIRGVTTFGYKQDPLILIDNMEVTTTDLARLQVDDIQAFSIMKDATATAVYGARGANGVILITTKQGREGRANLSVRLENSISAPTTNVDIADPITFMQLHNEAYFTRFGTPYYTPEQVHNTITQVDKNRYPITDWQDMVLRDYTTVQRAHLSVRGGGTVARYFVSSSLNQDNGLLKNPGNSNFNSNIKLRTYNLRSNINVNLTKSTELVVRLSGSFDDYRGPIPTGAGVYSMIMNANPVLFPAYYQDEPGFEHVKHIMFGNYDLEGDYLNPYAEVVKGYKESSRSNMYAQLELNQNLQSITEGLTFRMMGNTTRNAYFDVNRAYKPYFYGQGDIDPATGKTTIRLMNELKGSEYLDYQAGGKDVFSSLYFEAGLNYNRTFHDKHGVSGMLVSILRHSLNGNAESLQASLPFRNAGISGKMTYAYDSRYYAEFNFGYNGSERFSRKNRFGFFPSAGLAWSISNEKFWDPMRPFISNLRLRGTYGLVGNDQIGAPGDRFFYLSEVNLNANDNGATFGTKYDMKRPGISVVRYANPNISWETAHKSNFAIELGLFDKVQIVAEYFNDYRKRILMPRADIPNTMGLSSNIMANVGEAISKGFDGSLTYSQHITEQWWLRSQANFTYATGKYKVYEELDWGVDYKQRVNKPIRQNYGLVAERLFISDEEVLHAPVQQLSYGGLIGAPRGGDIKYIDINQDGVIDEFDIVPIGHPTTPEITYGFGFSSGYKGFDFSAFFQGTGRRSFWIDPSATAPFVQTGGAGSRGNRQLLQVYADHHWSEENPDPYALYPRFGPTANPNNIVSSTWWMRNGSFLRLKNIEAGYTLPKHITTKVKIDMLRIYANVSNPMVWSKFKMWDIEMAGNGMGYPLQRVFNMGINVSF